MEKSVGVTVFGYMDSDGLINDSKPEAYLCAYTVGKLQRLELDGVITSDYANKLKYVLPDKSDLRGRYYLEERDWHIFLNKVNGVDTIGVWDEVKNTYRRVIIDGHIDKPLGLEKCKWVEMVVNVHGTCNRINVVFSDFENVLRSIEITDPCCDQREEPLDSILLKSTSYGPGECEVTSGGQLENGSYMGALALFDEDNNRVNFSKFSNVTYVAESNFLGGQKTTKSVSFRFKDLPLGYNIGRLVIIENNSSKKFKVIDNVPCGDGVMNYTYTGAEGFYEAGILSHVLYKPRAFFKASGVFEHEGRLGVFDVEQERNWNLQQYVNNFKVGYKRGVVHNSQVHLHPTLRANENYSVAIHWNCKDNRPLTKDFPLINHNVATGNSITDCHGCEVPFFMATDTSKRTELFFSKSAFEISKLIKKGINTGEVIDIKDYIGGDLAPKAGDNSPFEFDVDSGSRANSIEPLGADTNDPLDLEYNIVPDSDPFADGSTVAAAFNSLFAWITSLFCDCLDADTYIIPFEDITSVHKASFDAAVSNTTTSFNALQNQIDAIKPNVGEVVEVKTEYKCKKEGEHRYEGSECYKCVGGYWHYLNNGILPSSVSYKKTKRDKFREFDVRASNDSGSRDSVTNDCVDRMDPIPYSEGLFGYWETDNKYPEDIGRDDCEPIFREFAGKPERLFKCPSFAKEEMGFSVVDGVPSKYDISSGMGENSYSIITGLRVWDVVTPDFMKPYVSETNPWTITYTPITQANKTVISTGSLHATFKSVSNGRTVLHGKHAINSGEYYDGNIGGKDESAERVGEQSTIPSYVFHGSDNDIWGSKETGHYILVEEEVSGYGWRFQLYAEGAKIGRNNGFFNPTYNNSGAVQGIAMTFSEPHNGGNVEYRCVKGFEYAPANQLVGKGNNFTYPLSNYHRESAMYLQIGGSGLTLNNEAGYIIGSKNLLGDNEDDRSFIGDTIDHESFIDLSACKSATVMVKRPNQYGSLYNRDYVTTGIEGTAESLESGKASGYFGNCFMGTYSVKRTGFISDKVSPILDTDIPKPAIESWLEASFISKLLPVIRIAKVIIDTYHYTCMVGKVSGSVPESSNLNDPKNLLSSLRKGMRAVNVPGGTITAPSKFVVVGLEIPVDAYMPCVLKSDNQFRTISYANVNLRATGEVKIGNPETNEETIAQVYAEKLHNMGYTSSFNGGDWIGNFMEIFYRKMNESSRFKSAIRTAALAILVYLFPIYCGLWSMEEQIHGFVSMVGGKAGGGNISFPITIAIAIFVSITVANIIAGAAIFYIKFLMNIDIHKKLITKMVGIKWSIPDIVHTLEDGSKSYSMHKNLLTRSQDNHWSYNHAYSDTNMIDVSFGCPVNYDTEWCPDKYQTIPMVSNIQKPSSSINSWKKFTPHNIIDIQKGRGEIMRVFSLKGRIYVHTTDSIIAVQARHKYSDLPNLNTPLARQSVLSYSRDLNAGIPNGYGGTKDPNAGIIDPSGYYFVDYDARRPFIFKGGSVIEHPYTGLEAFYDDNFEFEILKHVPGFANRDQKCASGIYYDMAIDKNRQLFYFSKKDYKLKPGIELSEGCYYENKVKIKDITNMSNFVPNNFTTVYDLKNKRYITKHYWNAELLFFNRHTMMAVKDSKIYDWTERHRFGEFFGVSYPMVVDVVLQSSKGYDVLRLKSLKFVGHVIEHRADGSQLRKSCDRLIDTVAVYNSYQGTGWREVNLQGDLDKPSTDKEKNWTNNINGITFSGFNNNVPDNQAVFNVWNEELRTWGANYPFDKNDDSFKDDYVGVKFIIHKKSNEQVFVRAIKATFETD